MSTTPTLHNVLSFNGKDSYIELSDPFEDPAVFTVSLWAKPAGINNLDWNSLMGKVGDQHDKPNLSSPPKGNALHFSSYAPTGQRYTADIPNFFEKDVWVHIAWVKREKKYEIYKNGELVGTWDAPETVFTTSTSYWIGRVNRFWLGEIAEVRIWKGAFSQAEIQRDMSRRLVGTEPLLSRYFPLSEGEGTTAYDWAGKGHGRIVGATWTKSELPVEETAERPSIGIVAVNLEGDEYVELAVSNAPYRLADHRLRAVGANKEFVFPKDAMIVPGRRVRVYTNKVDADTGGYSFNSNTPIWNPEGDVAQLYSDRGQYLFVYPYGTGAPKALSAVVFHGQHTHEPYAKDTPLSIVVNAAVFGGRPGDTVPDLGAIVCFSWDRNAAGVQNVRDQQRATVTREGQKLTVRSGYYRFEGTVSGNVFEGSYFNPNDELCGSFKLSSLP